MTAYSGAHF